MLKVTSKPDGITQSDLEQIFSKYTILKSDERIEEDGSISYEVELKENESTARQKLDRTVQIIRGERYTIRVDDFRGESRRRGQPSPSPTPTPAP